VMHFRKRSNLSTWTINVPSQFVGMSYEAASSNGPAVQGQPLDSDMRQNRVTWTRLTLPEKFGGYAPDGSVMTELLVKRRIPGKLVKEVLRPLHGIKITKTRRGKFEVIYSREEKKVPVYKPNRDNRIAGIDPGGRTCLVVYNPSGDKTLPGNPPTITEFMPDDAARLDADYRRANNLRTQRDALPPGSSRQSKKLRKAELRIRERMTNLARDSHIQMTAKIFSRVGTIFLPELDIAEIVRRIQHDNRPRVINGTAVRRMLHLSHRSFVKYINHAARVHGKKLYHPDERFTTVCCPQCLYLRPSFAGTVFHCQTCGYEADRDSKSALVLMIKQLKGTCWL